MASDLCYTSWYLVLLLAMSVAVDPQVSDKEVAIEVRLSETAKSNSAVLHARGVGPVESGTAGTEGIVSLQDHWRSVLRAEQFQLANLVRFFGIVEGRSGIAPPPEWEALLVWHVALECGEKDMEQGRKNSIRSRRLHAEITEHYPGLVPGSDLPAGAKEPDWSNCTIKGEFGVQTPPGTFLTYADGRLTLKQNDDQVPVAADMEREFREAGVGGRCVARVGGPQSFVAIGGVEPRTFPLFSLDAHSGEILWKTTVAALRFEFEYERFVGPTSHNVWLRTDGKRLGVFGGSHWGYYLEVYDVESGRLLMTFRAE